MRNIGLYPSYNVGGSCTQTIPRSLQIMNGIAHKVITFPTLLCRCFLFNTIDTVTNLILNKKHFFVLLPKIATFNHN
jgi:hypothetical protein